MTVNDLVLNIAVNLDRISRFAMEGREKRVKQFIDDNDVYINQVSNLKLNDKFGKTFKLFERDFKKLRNQNHLDSEWCEEVLTWANILQHRAKLA